jgi:hypothetical protein
MPDRYDEPVTDTGRRVPDVLADKFTELGVPPDEWDMYAYAIRQTPGWPALVAQCKDRAQLDHLTETGVTAP